MAPHKQGVQEMLKSIDAAADFEDSLGETSPLSRKTWVAIKMVSGLRQYCVVISHTEHSCRPLCSPTQSLSFACRRISCQPAAPTAPESLSQTHLSPATSTFCRARLLPARPLLQRTCTLLVSSEMTSSQSAKRPRSAGLRLSWTPNTGPPPPCCSGTLTEFSSAGTNPRSTPLCSR
jgi:hypothetical protein